MWLELVSDLGLGIPGVEKDGMAMRRYRSIGLIAVAVMMVACGRSMKGSASNQAMVENVAPGPTEAAPAAKDPAAPSPTPIPYPNAAVAPRDPATGQATGKRMHKPAALTQ